ncbi:glucose 1-dehydrogenase [Zavarzinia compransoris]|uniref:Dehydrogenase n=1 Tax=Zavarzinia compransoris TaxID=1264899 RepID=A0A317DSW6_9PROT|nr:glucose 1-dehydrogenase [Zavarzinia compransoris]PWR17777.1 dehydrogenase [Zavarzinia compransoris]TDP49306.1 NAD(P)-dependent dehydrogenase (short-subunit alcohol dehydrogenase family) [Zavarzinia compransoris]
MTQTATLPLATLPLDGKTALVTGAARGLGAETARRLAAAGAAVVLTDVLTEAGEATAAAIGGAARFMTHDVTAEDDWRRVVNATIDATGGFDILVNNAGIEAVHAAADTTLETFERVMRVNATGVFLGLREASVAMRPGGRAGRGGSIVNLSSIAGLRGVPGLTAYCASKGAVRLMTKATALEFAALGYGIRVNSIHPGLIMTDMGKAALRNIVAAGLAEDERVVSQAFDARQPLGLGRPEDIAEAVLFLAGDASGWVTGAELSVDGGFAAG